MVVYDLIERAVMWLHALPPFPVWLLLGIVLGLPTTLIHELGHGIAANMIAKASVKIEISPYGIDWAGECRLDPGSQVSVGAYMAVVAAGPLASLTQGVTAVWLSTTLTPGSAAYAVVAVFGLWGLLAAVLTLVPNSQPELHSDGQKLLDLTRLVVGGRVADWIVLSTGAEDPHTATSVPPPG